MSLSTAGSMRAVLELRTRIEERESKVMLWVRKPHMSIGELQHDDDASEDAEQEVCVGLVHDVTQVRNEEGEIAFSVEVVLEEEISQEHAIWLGVDTTQNFVVPYHALQACMLTNAMLVNYELFYFCQERQWSAQVTSTEAMMNMVRGLSDEAKKLVKCWLWKYVIARVQSSIAQHLRTAAVKETGMLQLQFEKRSRRVVRTQAMCLCTMPTMEQFDPLAHEVKNLAVTGKMVVQTGDSLFTADVISVRGGKRYYFQTDGPAYKEWNCNVPTYKQMLSDYTTWHLLAFGKDPDAFLEDIVQKVCVDLVKKMEFKLQGQRCELAWQNLVKPLVFAVTCDAMVQTQGYWRAARRVRMEDTDLWLMWMERGAVPQHARLFLETKVQDFSMEHWNRKVSEIPIEPKFFLGCGAREGIHGGMAGETHDEFIAVCDHLYKDSSGYWRPAELIATEGEMSTVRFWCGKKQVSSSKLKLFCALSLDRIDVADESIASGDSFAVSMIDAARDRAKQVAVKPAVATFDRNTVVNGIQVTRCVQFKETVYFIFTAIDGEERKLSLAAVKRARVAVRDLVKVYEEWHETEYGMAIAESLANGSSDGSDSEEVRSADSSAEHDSDEDVVPKFVPSNGSESEEDIADRRDGCDDDTQELHNIMVSCGAGDYDVFRPPVVWSEAQTKAVRNLFKKAKGNSVKLAAGIRKVGLPQLSAEVRKVFGKHCVVFAPHFEDEDIMANMDPVERLESYFSFVGTVVGESLLTQEDKSDVELLVRSEVDPEITWTVALEHVMRNLEELHSLMAQTVEPHTYARKISNPALFSYMEQRNVKNVALDDYLLRKECSMVQSESDDDAEMLAADKTARRDAGRDFFMEAEAREMSEQRKKEAAAALAAAAKSSKKQGHLSDPVDMDSSRGDDDDVERELQQRGPKDNREPLSEKAMRKGYKLCLRYDCDFILNPGEKQCACGCMTQAHCVCEFCATAYQPMKQNMCLSCKKCLPHDAKAYQNQMQQDALAESLSSEVKGGEKTSKSRSAELLLRKDRHVHFMMQGAGSGAPKAVMQFKGVTQAMINLERLSTRSARDSTMRTSFIPGCTNKFTYNLLKNLSEQRYGLLGTAVSMWEFIPMVGDWCSEWFYDAEKDSATLMTDAQIKAWRATVLTEDMFLKTKENAGKTMLKLSGRTYKNQMEAMALVLVAYRNKHLPCDRDEAMSWATILDVIDALHQQRTDYVSAAIELTAQNGFDAVEALDMLRAEFPLVHMPEQMQLTDVPVMTVMHQCEEHRHNLTGDNFPDEHECKCKFTRYVKALLQAVKKGTTISQYVAPKAVSGQQAKPRGGGVLEGEDESDATPAASTSKAAKNKAKRARVKADLKEFREIKNGGEGDASSKKDAVPMTYEFARVDDKVFSGAHSTKAYQMTNALCEECDHPKRICTRTLSAAKCTLPSCQFEHNIDFKKITHAKIKKFPILEALLVGRFDGLYGQTNAVRFPASAGSQSKMKDALRDFVLNLQPFEEPQAAIPHPKAAPVRTVDPAEQNLVGGRSGATVAQENRTEFSHKIPSLKEGAEHEVEVKMQSTVVFPDKLGETKIVAGFNFTVDIPDTATGRPRKFEFQVLDAGETIGTQQQRCEFVSAGATHRVQGGNAEVLDGHVQDSRTYMDGAPGSMSDVYNTSMASFDFEVSPDVIRLEQESVNAALTEGSTVAPFISAVLSQPYAADHAECKMFLSEDQRLSWHVGLPSGCVDENKELIDVPVVWKFYTTRHAYAAKLLTMTEDGVVTSFDEDEKVIDDSWQGMKLQQLKKMSGELNETFTVTYFACKTVQETLARTRLTMPDYIIQPQEVDQVGAGLSVQVAGRTVTTSALASMLLTLTSVALMADCSNPIHAEDSWGGVYDLSAFAEHDLAYDSACGRDASSPACLEDHNSGDLKAQYGSREAMLTNDVSQTFSESKSLGVKLLTPTDPVILGGKWRGVTKAITFHVNAKSMIRLLGLLTQLLPIMEDWRTFNDIHFTHWTESKGRTVADDSSLSHKRGSSTEDEWTPITIDMTVSKDVAFTLLRRAVSAQIVLEQQAVTGRQSSTDPGDEWLFKLGEVMAEQAKWAEVVWADENQEMKIQNLQGMYRSLKQNGRANPDMYASVVDDHFSDLPEGLKETLKNTMQFGVKTGIKKPNQTTEAKPSMTATRNREAVWKHLRKFVANGWLLAFPPSCQWLLKKSWRLLVSSTHFVEQKGGNKERLVADLGNPGNRDIGEDANSLSPDLDYCTVQADYINDVAEQICMDMSEKDLTNEVDLVGLKADVKAAFMQVALHLTDVGTLCMEFEGWTFVFVRTPFGWKWATHTFSTFTAAIKQKITNFNKNGWHNKEKQHMDPWRRMFRRLKLVKTAQSDLMAHGIDATPFLNRARLVWSSFLIFCYVDDAYALTEKLGGRTFLLCDILRTAGNMLLGFGSWSISKTEEDGFYAWIHKFTGIIIDTTDAPQIYVSFSKDRLQKMDSLLAGVDFSHSTLSLGQVQTVFGNMMWIVKVYSMMRPWLAPWRRCMVGVSTIEAQPNLRVSSKMAGESPVKAQKKLEKDTSMMRMFLQKLIANKEEHGETHKTCVMPIAVLRDSEACYDKDDAIPKASFGGDASGTCWSVVCHTLRQAMVIYMPPALQIAIKRAGDERMKDEPLRRFIIAIAEHMVAAMALLQWGEVWHAQGYRAAFYHTDSQNSFAWVKSGFACNDIAQEISRLIGALQAYFTLHLLPVWWPSAINLMADVLSRMLDADGNVIMSMHHKWEELNATLADPYALVQPNIEVQNFLSWIKNVKNAFSELSPIRLFSEKKMLLATRGSQFPSMRQRLYAFRESFTVSDAMARCKATLNKALSFASLGSGGCIGLMGVLRTAIWRPRWGAEAVSVKADMWEGLTDTPCFSDVLLLPVCVLLWCHMIEVTMPCIDYSSSGHKRGEFGDTGWLWLYAIRFAIAMAPTIIFSEMADNAVNVMGGATFRRIVAALRVSYDVTWRIVKVWDYGDGSHRKRIILVAVHKSRAGGTRFEMPKPVFDCTNPHTAWDTAVPDAQVPDDHWRDQPLNMLYSWRAPVPGMMHKLGRLSDDMGPSTDPSLCFSFDGTNNGPTTHGGGGTKPSMKWNRGEQIIWRRLTCVVEFYMIASVSYTLRDFHESFFAASGGTDLTVFLRDCVNQGWPAASAYHIALAVGRHVRQVCGLVTEVVVPVPKSAKQDVQLQLPQTEVSHLWLDECGVFRACSLQKQVSARQVEIQIQGRSVLAAARRLWPLILGLDGSQATNVRTDSAQMNAAEVMFADMCAARAGAESLMHGVEHAAEAAYMYLNASNVWMPCTLIEMITVDLALVRSGEGELQVQAGLIKESYEECFGLHVTAELSKARFVQQRHAQVEEQLSCKDQAQPERHNCCDIKHELFSALSAPRGGKRGVQSKSTHVPAAGVPSEEDCLLHLRESPDTDWSVPLHPNLSNKKVRQKLKGYMQDKEWAQMHHFLCMLNEVELEDGTSKQYAMGVRHFLEFLARYPMLSHLSPAHAQTGAIFEPAVWVPKQVEKVLIDFVLHEAGVRGNGWNSVRGKLFGIRHANIRAGLDNPLMGKHRLNQVMRALRKYNGPKAGKRPTSRAMILRMEKLLDYQNDVVDLVLLAAAVTSWHFMMRSAEYCAKLAQGRFDSDRVLRRKDIKFYKNGKITSRFLVADEVRVTFGKSKTTAGGEIRTHYATDHSCCVVKVLGLLFESFTDVDTEAPLFSWPPGSTMKGEGVRYVDMVKLIKSAAKQCGLDPKEYSSHSQRRGGASAYLLSGGMSLEEIRIFGRWKSISSLQLYIEPAIGVLAKAAQHKVLSGQENHELIRAEPPRPRDFMRMKVKKTLQKMQQQTQEKKQASSGTRY